MRRIGKPGALWARGDVDNRDGWAMGVGVQPKRRPWRLAWPKMQTRYQKIGRSRARQVAPGAHAVARDGHFVAGLFKSLPHFHEERQVSFSN